MASPLRTLQENARQEAADDGNFYKHLLFFFELRVPGSVAPQTKGRTQFVFPLVVSPTAYSISEPFTVEKTPTQGGGLYVEENGIVMRTIRLRGTTGFKPRPLVKQAGNLLPPSGPYALGAVRADQRSFNRSLPSSVLQAISGQRHLHYLQDAVFRIYADLKRDPETNQGTQLFFHNPTDKEAWLVVPEKFEVNRDASGMGRTAYEYDIEMTAVAPTSQVDRGFSEDKGLLDTIKDGIRTSQSFLDGAAGFVNDITNTVNEIRTFVADIDNIVDSFTNLTDAVDSFVTGATDLIQAPAALVTSVAESLEGVSNTLENLADAGVNIPSPYINAWRQAEQAVNKLGMVPQLFENDTQKRIRNIKERQQGRTSTLLRAAQTTAPATIEAFGQLGTAPLPGTVNRSKADYRVGINVNRYSSARSYRLEQGDTLMSLAARFLNDARLWQDIALLNGLKPPYTDTMATIDLGGPSNPIPGVLSTGNDIQIPTFGRSTQSQTLLPVLGVPNTAPFEEQLLGVDFALTVDEQGFFDWEIDFDHGADDLKKARGIACLSQGMTVRLNVERGTNPLYQRLGLDQFVGLGNPGVDAETAKLRVIDAVEADPRISRVRRIDTLESSADVAAVDADVEVRGFARGISTQAIGAL